jgi:hypothetical protein
LVESLDDFAELVLDVHRDRLKEAIGTYSLPLTDKFWHNNCSIVLVLFLVGGLPTRGLSLVWLYTLGRRVEVLISSSK